jgi:hypothetical protein
LPRWLLAADRSVKSDGLKKQRPFAAVFVLTSSILNALTTPSWVKVCRNPAGME